MKPNQVPVAPGPLRLFSAKGRFHALLALVLASLMLTSPAMADEYGDVLQLYRGAKFAEALAKAEQYLSGKPRDPQMRFLKGVVLSDSGKTDEALATFAKLTEDFPELPEPYNNMAVIYAAQNQFDKARVALEMAVRTNPGYATAHENLGDIYVRLAGQSYARSQQLDPAARTVPPKLKLVSDLVTLTSKPGSKSGKSGG